MSPRGKKAAEESSGPVLAPVDNYEEKTDDFRTDEETVRAERRYQQDQDPEYHVNNPTLDATGEEHNPEKQVELRQQIIEAEEQAAVDAVDWETVEEDEQ